MTAIGTFDDILALAPQHEELLRGIRALVLSDNKDAVEVARPGDRAVSWGWGPKKMSEAYVYALPYTNHVNIGFYQGASLSDPSAILKGTGKALRHASVTSLDELQNTKLKALISSAREERRAALEI